MNADLKSLIQLQDIDLKIQELDRQIQDAPAQIQHLKETLESSGAHLEALKQQLAEQQKERRKTEMDVEALRAKLARYKDQLMQVKTNKEYSAMLKEIEVCDEEIRGGEDKILEFMESTDALESEIRREGDTFQQKSALTGKQQRELETQIETNRKAISELSARRVGLAAAINADLLSLYRKITSHRKGIALAEARDECCMACRVRMRPQIFNDVQKNDRILTCDSCGRILYWSPPAPAQSAATPPQETGSTSMAAPGAGS